MSIINPFKKTHKTGAESSSDTRRIHNLIILDESGSMMSIYQPALSGVNETLQTIRQAQDEHPEQRHSVTLIAFDTSHFNQIYRNTPASEAADITPGQYRPQGGTPLYDAMGRGITDLRSSVAEGDVVLVTIITDGYENASREYTGTAIRHLVETLKKEGWVFTYIGANQDVDAVCSELDIENYLAFDADDLSTHAMFAKEISSRKKFYKGISENKDFNTLSNAYFQSDEEDGDTNSMPF